MKIVEVKAAKEFAYTFLPDPILKMAVNAVLDNAPTIDAAEVVHGSWEEWWPGDCALIMTGEEMLYQCSACTAKYSHVDGFRYCPHCGAFMDK